MPRSARLHHAYMLVRSVIKISEAICQTIYKNGNKFRHAHIIHTKNASI